MPRHKTKSQKRSLQSQYIYILIFTATFMQELFKRESADLRVSPRTIMTCISSGMAPKSHRGRRTGLAIVCMYVCLCRLTSRGAFRISRPDSGSSISGRLLHVGPLLRETGEHWNALIHIHTRPHLCTAMLEYQQPLLL